MIAQIAVGKRSGTQAVDTRPANGMPTMKMMFSQFACLCQLVHVMLFSEMCCFFLVSCDFLPSGCRFDPKSRPVRPSGLSRVEDIASRVSDRERKIAILSIESVRTDCIRDNKRDHTQRIEHNIHVT